MSASAVIGEAGHGPGVAVSAGTSSDGLASVVAVGVVEDAAAPDAIVTGDGTDDPTVGATDPTGIAEHPARTSVTMAIENRRIDGLLRRAWVTPTRTAVSHLEPAAGLSPAVPGARLSPARRCH
jgi:hypothetical protein